MQRQGAVQEAGAGQGGAVLVQGGAGRLLHARVARQAEVVVRAEHHPLGPLHLHYGPRLALEDAEVRDQVLLAGRTQDLDALVAPRLLEQIGNRRSHQE